MSRAVTRMICATGTLQRRWRRMNTILFYSKRIFILFFPLFDLNRTRRNSYCRANIETSLARRRFIDLIFYYSYFFFFSFGLFRLLFLGRVIFYIFSALRTTAIFKDRTIAGTCYYYTSSYYIFFLKCARTVYGILMNAIFATITPAHCPPRAE